MIISYKKSHDTKTFLRKFERFLVSIKSLLGHFTHTRFFFNLLNIFCSMEFFIHAIYVTMESTRSVKLANISGFSADYEGHLCGISREYIRHFELSQIYQNSHMTFFVNELKIHRLL